jgi:amino acid adenylation domain-containing protein
MQSMVNERVNELILEMARRGIRLAVTDGRLAVNAPPGSLTESLKNDIRLHRDALIDELARIGAVDGREAMAPIVPDPGSAHLPFRLSDLQLGFYMANDPYMEYHVRPHCYMEDDSDAIDVARYEAAWNRTLRRHALGLHVINAELMLEKVQGPPPISIPVHDLRDLDPAARDAALLGIRGRMERRELPLDAWPWFDLCVSVRRDDDGRERWRTHYNHNNFFVDGYATTQLLEEVRTCYEAPETTLPPRTLSYRDAVLAIAALESTPAGQRAKTYWLSRLESLPPPPDLPQVAGLERRCRSRLDRRDGLLSGERWDAFKRNAVANGITPSNAMIAAYAHVISVWSQSDRFILSQMVTRRFAELHPEIKSLLGNFASLYPLEIRIDRGLGFRDNAEAIQNRVVEDIRHLQYGGMQVMQELNRLKGGFGTAPSPYVVGSGLFLKGYRKSDYVVLETSQTVLDHQFFELPDGGCHYVWDLIEAFFPPGMIDAMWDAYARLLGALCDEPDAWVAPVRGLVDARHLEPRVARNRSAEAFPEALLHRPLDAHLRDCPQRIAVRQAGRDLDYAGLGAWSDAIAAEIVRRVGASNAERTVAVAMPRCRETVAAVLGILKAGAAYVPIDPNLPERRRELLIRDAGAALVLTTASLRDGLSWPEDIETLSLDVDAETPRIEVGVADAAPCGPDRLAYIIYTSGTTGRPKGVMIEHRAAMNTVQDINRRFGIGPDDRLFGISPFNFDLSVYDIFGALEAGATLVYPDVGAALDPNHWLDTILAERITVWNTVPALMDLLLESAERRGSTLDSLRLVMLSGDRVPTDLPERIHRAAPNATVVSLGGATEAAIWSILYPLERGRRYEASVPYGYPMANQRWHIRDRFGEDVPTWVPGELLIAGDGLARGYHGDAEKTARSFATDPAGGERLYRTGDVGRYLPDGCLEIHGRIDHQVKVQGHRIELGEIEATLLRHPDVRQAVVAVRETGARQVRQLVAYVCPTEPRADLAATLERHLQQELPIYMTPQHWVVLDRMPTTANGKLDRAALAALVVDAAAEGARSRPYVAPRTACERELAGIWQEVLQIERIGVDDDFFDLGGQSFDAIRIFALIRNRHDRQFTLGDIWQTRTIAAFATRLSSADGARDGDPLVPLDPSKSGRPIFLVHPAGGTVHGYAALSRALTRPTYGFQARWRTDGTPPPTDIPELAAAYVQRLKQAQPEGPYTLGGWSSGGAVAFEMARLLEAEGRDVDRVYLLDAPAPWRRPLPDLQTLVAWFIEDLALGLPVDRLPACDPHAAPGEALAAAAGAMRAYGGDLDPALLLPIFEVFIDMVRMGGEYAPGRVRAEIVVVRVQHDIVSEFVDHPAFAEPGWGWAPYADGGIVAVSAPGDHHRFLGDEALPAWAGVFAV